MIAGGGTGGHIIPALAIARELADRYQAEILFIGTARGLESRLVPQAGFKLELIEVGPLNRVSLATRMRTVAQLPMSVLSCMRFLREFRADAVLGVGGYASGPAMAAALLKRVPAMAFEPNAVPGMVNRMVGRYVQAAAVNFPPAAKWFRNAEVTGIPVRSEFFSIAAQPPANPHLLIFGGSQGARIFNTLLPPLAPALLESVPALTLLHQAGAKNADATRSAYEASGADPARWRVESFLDDMAAQFAAAHLVLARSGASTVAELAAAGKPSLLIPFAAAADDHQRRNAEVMVEAGAAVMIEERELDQPSRIIETIRNMLCDTAALQEMSFQARTLAHPSAASQIAKILIGLALRSNR